MTAAATRAGTFLAVAGALHAAVNARRFARVRPRSISGARISVLVPARNEAKRIRPLLDSLRDQDVSEVVVLDDGSTDGTAAVVRNSDDPRLRLIRGRPLPTGWLGKPNACAQLAAAAATDSDLLAFLDADVRLEPGAIAGAVACLREKDVELLSVWPRQEAVTFAERLVQPLLLWAVLTFLPLRRVQRSRKTSLAAANGQFLLVRRDAYRATGGHAASPAAVLDDMALARAFKRSGFRTAVVSGQDVAACRMYETWNEIREGYTKSLWSAFGSPAGAVAVAGGLLLGWTVPALMALRGSRAGIAGVLAAVAGRVMSARAGGDRWWPDAALHPLSAATLSYLTLRSLVEQRRGRLSWRGRPVPSR